MPEIDTPGKITPEQMNPTEASSQENRWKKKLRNVGKTINDYNGVIFLLRQKLPWPLRWEVFTGH
jgi:hypothetical protein